MRLIVLNTTRTGEKSLVVHSISREYGRRSFIVNAGPKTLMSLFLPLNIIDAEVVENRKSDLWRLRSIKSAEPLGGIRSDIYRNTMTLFMSEVLFRTLREGVFEDSLYEWCEKSILTLNALEGGYSNYHLWFLLELCSVLGFRPSIEDMAPFTGRYHSTVSALLSKDFAGFMMTPLNGESRNALASIFIKYLSVHTEFAIEVRSLSVLGEIFR